MHLRYTKRLQKAPAGAFFVALLLWLFVGRYGWASCNLAANAAVESVQVEAVFDGDTVRLVDGRKVRLLGINTPEVRHGKKPAQPVAEEARQQLLALLQQRPIKLMVGSDSHDRYGRVLGHLFTGQGVNVTAQLLREGAGFQVAMVPNLAFVECYRFAEQEARDAPRGVWADPYYRPVSSESDELTDGYGRIYGRVQSVELTKGAVFVELEGNVSLKVERKVAPYIDADLMDRLVTLSRQHHNRGNLQLEAQGWLSDRLTWNGNTPDLVRKGKRKRYQMKITHQVSWRELPVK